MKGSIAEVYERFSGDDLECLREWLPTNSGLSPFAPPARLNKEYRREEVNKLKALRDKFTNLDGWNAAPEPRIQVPNLALKYPELGIEGKADFWRERKDFAIYDFLHPLVGYVDLTALLAYQTTREYVERIFIKTCLDAYDHIVSHQLNIKTTITLEDPVLSKLCANAFSRKAGLQVSTDEFAKNNDYWNTRETDAQGAGRVVHSLNDLAIHVYTEVGRKGKLHVPPAAQGLPRGSNNYAFNQSDEKSASVLP